MTPSTVQWQVTTHGPDQAIALGRCIGQAIQTNLFIALSGDLGAGKTTFTKGLVAGMGIPAPVTSPTFTLINDYETERGLQARRLVHVDVYRLETASTAELDGIGFSDLMDDLEAPDTPGLLVLVVEWADRLGPLLPQHRLDVISAPHADDPDARLVTLRAWGLTAESLLQHSQKAWR